MTTIWNEVVQEGIFYVREDMLAAENAKAFFAQKTCCGVAVNGANQVVGLYIVYPKYEGRCSHICGINYALTKACRDIGIEKPLMMDAMLQARKRGFKVIQLSAIKTNYRDRSLYEKLGFFQLGVIKRGFRLPNGKYVDLCPYWRNI